MQRVHQIARLRLDGADIVDRAPFADLFERQDGRWRMTFAFGVVPVDAPASDS
ncbi:MAG TPA: hypothetical protein VK698_12850 [Kofleriaceae bacterium]|nr:hypothetical protein [Kofleriaceae bacterium]